jgi:hypothetical protein
VRKSVELPQGSDGIAWYMAGARRRLSTDVIAGGGSSSVRAISGLCVSARRIVSRAGPARSGSSPYRSATEGAASSSCRGHSAEPAELALEKAEAFATAHSTADFCNGCGRQLASACIYWREWVVRRAEKVTFRDDRCVNRKISIEFLVPEDAPVYGAPTGQRFWLVPLSVMRRNALVNYDLYDEEEHRITSPGLWFTQHLDESLLRAVASIKSSGNLSEETAAFIRDVIAGAPERVQERLDSLESKTAPAGILKLVDEHPFFAVILHRLGFNRTLYAFIEADPCRRHRILHMSIDEPLTLYQREPGLPDPGDAAADGHDGLSYEMRRAAPWWNLHRLAASVGWIPMSVRFLVPAAENAASFYFTIEAPPGVHIVEASLLAGVPPAEDSDKSEQPRHPSFDRVRLYLPIVGLHVTAVPNGSLSRAQVHLQVATRGWYTTMLLSCWATFLLLVAVLLHVHTNAITTPADAIVVLAGVAAAVATLIAQGEFAGMAGRLLTLPRALAAVEAALPLIAATLFLFSGPKEAHRRQWELLSICGVAAVITIIISISWLRAHWRLSRSRKITSRPETARDPHGSNDNPRSFWKIAQDHGYTKPAIRVDSAEAWHRHFNWTEEVEADAEALLGRVQPRSR